MEEATPGASEGEALGQEVKQLHQGGFLLLCFPSPPLPLFLPLLLPSLHPKPPPHSHSSFILSFLPFSDIHFPQFLLGFPSRLGRGSTWTAKVEGSGPAAGRCAGYLD